MHKLLHYRQMISFSFVLKTSKFRVFKLQLLPPVTTNIFLPAG